MISIKKLFENWLPQFLKKKRVLSIGSMLPTRQMLPSRGNINKIKKMNSSLSNMNKNIQQR